MQSQSRSYWAWLYLETCPYLPRQSGSERVRRCVSARLHRHDEALPPHPPPTLTPVPIHDAIAIPSPSPYPLTPRTRTNLQPPFPASAGHELGKTPRHIGPLGRRLNLRVQEGEEEEEGEGEGDEEAPPSYEEHVFDRLVDDADDDDVVRGRGRGGGGDVLRGG